MPRFPLAARPGTLAAPEVDTEVVENVLRPWHVILFNDEIHTFDEVIFQVVKATGCTYAEAERHAWTVHTKGKSDVYEGDFEDCLRVQGVLREIELVTQIEG